MKVSTYLNLNKKMKNWRIGSDYSQKDMALKLGLSVPTYSNYENGYSDPPIEVIQDFCKVIGISEELFFSGRKNTSNGIFYSYSDILNGIIQLEKAGFQINYTARVNKETNSITTAIEIDNPQFNSMLSRWSELSLKLKEKEIDVEEYNIWISELITSFNYPIEPKLD